MSNFAKFFNNEHEYYKNLCIAEQLLAKYIYILFNNNDLVGLYNYGEFNQVRGSMLLAIRLKPDYPYKKKDKEYDRYEVYNYEHVYEAEFTICLNGDIDNTTSIDIGFRINDADCALVETMNQIPVSDISKVKFPEWFVRKTTKFLATKNKS